MVSLEQGSRNNFLKKSFFTILCVWWYPSFYQFRVLFTGSREEVNQFTDGLTNNGTDGPIAIKKKLTRSFGSSELKNLKYFD